MRLGLVLDPVFTFPEGTEADVSFFCTSDAVGLSCELTVKHTTSLASPDRMREELAKMLSTEEFTKLAQDWRLMTKAEIREYRQRQKEEAGANLDREEGERAGPAQS